MTTADVGVIYAATKQDRYVEEAFLSAESVKRFAPHLPITLFTDRPGHPLCALGVFDRVERLQPVTGFESAWAEGQLGRIDCLGRTPYRITLNLDTDTRVYTPEIATVFDRLGDDDIALVEESPDVSISRGQTGRRMFNVGFILYRVNPRVSQWLEAWSARVRRNFTFALQSPLPFIEELAHIGDEAARRSLLRIDQVALMEILSPDRNVLGLRACQLENAWNYRGSRVDFCQPERVKIAHSDAFKTSTLPDLLAVAFHWNDQGRAVDAAAIYEYVAARARPETARKSSRLAFWRRAGRPPEEWASPLLRNADLHLMHGQLREATEMFAHVIPTDPMLPHALAGRARIALRLGDNATAQDLAHNAFALMPRSPYIAAIYGAALLAAGRRPQAIPVLERAAARGNAAAATQLGKAHFEAEDYSASATAFLRALAIDPAHEIAANNLLHALAGSRRYAELVDHTDRQFAQRPWHVTALAFRAVALAELGRGTEERALADLPRLVEVSRLATPPGWSSQDAFHRDVARAILRHPTLRPDPKEHATRNGRHSADLSQESDPALSALNGLILAAAAERVAATKADNHPFARAVPRGYGLHAWSVVMTQAGHQIAHMHARAWLSGVYYVEVPEEVSLTDTTHSGWLRFGRAEERWHRPETRTIERLICPAPGMLVTFPSFFWHQTVPLAVPKRRISYAFDILPM